MIIYGYKIDLYHNSVMKEIGATLLTAEDLKHISCLSEGRFAAALVKANNENLYEHMVKYLNKFDDLEHYAKAFKNGALYIGRKLELDGESGEDLGEYTLNELQTHKFFNYCCSSGGRLFSVV